MKIKRPSALKKLILYMMLLILAIQTIVFFLLFLVSGVFTLASNESIFNFDQQASNRATGINSELNAIANNAKIELENLNIYTQALCENNNLRTSELYINDQAFGMFSQQAMIMLIELTTKVRVSGAFVILENSNSNPHDLGLHSAIYIRDSDPLIYLEDSSDIYMVRGDIGLVKNKKISLSSMWDSNMKLDSDSSFYYQPTTTARQNINANISDLGFWARPFEVFEDRSEVITYSLPLIGKDGYVYGVLGVEISTQMLANNWLKTIDSTGMGSYSGVGKIENNTLIADSFIAGSVLGQQKIAKDASNITFSSISDEKANIVEAKIASGENMYFSVHPLTIYGNQPLYKDSQWAFFSFESKQSLLQSSYRIYFFTVITALITILFCIVLIIVITNYATKDILNLSKSVRAMDPNKKMIFEKINLTEIDELTTAIEHLNNDLIDSSKKISQIMELTASPLGFFEVLKDSQLVFLTGSLFRLLDIKQPVDSENDNYVPLADFQIIIDQILSGKVENQTDIYYWKPSKIASVGKWFKMSTARTAHEFLGVITDISQEMLKQQQLEYELDYDNLTRLLNRKSFTKRCFEKINSQPHLTGTMLFADLDNLKYINDTYSHETGDRYIIEAAAMLSKLSEHGGVVARISGDEFIVYIHGFDSANQAKDSVIEWIFDNFTNTIILPDGVVQKIRISVGLSIYPRDSENINELIKYADFAMYEVKTTAKGSISEFNKQSYIKKSYIFEKAELLNKLLDERRITFHFQPIVDVNKINLYGYEALMRSTMSEFKSPYEIITVALAQSKLYHIEKLTFFGISEWLEANSSRLGERTLFMNSISNQMLNKEDMDFLINNYAKYYSNVVVEVTEQEDGNNQNIMAEKLNFARNLLKSQIAIDDFGSGYSNEIRILSISPDIIKIDMGLIQGIESDKDKQTFVSNIISYGKQRGIRMLAEGVETLPELEKVIELGIDYVQGYYFARPDPALLELEQKHKDTIINIKNRLKG